MHRNANISIPNYIMCTQLNRIVLYIYTHEWLLHTATCIHLYNCKSLGSGCIWVTSWLHFIQVYLHAKAYTVSLNFNDYIYSLTHKNVYTPKHAYTHMCIYIDTPVHYNYINIKFSHTSMAMA